ncbi:MAG: hypothetical protein AABX54_05125 [Nanoarchaeota archaeon]
MVSEVKLFLDRAEDEILLSQKDLELSTNNETKGILGIPKEKTFFYSVISHAYYSIFYAAKAYLFQKGIRTESPEIHKKTYLEFKKCVDKKFLDYELLRIYENEISKAESLLNIFFLEKEKRGRFVYNVKSEANLPFAKESIENAKKFVSVIKAILEL